MRKLNTDAFEEFKQSVFDRGNFLEMTSQGEIRAIQQLFEQRANVSSQRVSEAQRQELEVGQNNSASQAANEPSRLPSPDLLETFE